MDPGEEARLIARARRGDRDAFGRLVDAHQAAVRGFARRFCGDPASAEDAAQDAFARTWETLGRVREDASLRAYVCGVAFNIWRTQARGRRREQARETAFAADREAHETPGGDIAARLALRRAMDALPDTQRACVALCLGQDFTHAEAAEALGIPLGTVKSHVLRGRARLRTALGLAENDAS